MELQSDILRGPVQKIYSVHVVAVGLKMLNRCWTGRHIEISPAPVVTMTNTIAILLRALLSASREQIYMDLMQVLRSVEAGSEMFGVLRLARSQQTGFASIPKG
jgi:hypothetical protein